MRREGKGRTGGIFNDVLPVHTSPSGTQYVLIEDLRAFELRELMREALNQLRQRNHLTPT